MLLPELVVKTRALVDAQKYDEVLQLLTPSMLRRRKSAELYQLAGFACHDADRKEEAIRYYSKSIELGNKDASLFNNRGTCYAELGQLTDAIADYDEAIRLDATVAEVYVNRGVAQRRLENTEAALESFNLAIVMDKRHQLAYKRRAELHFEFGRYLEALSDYEALAKLYRRPDYELYISRAACLSKLKRYSEALVLYSKCVKLKPELAEAYIERASCYVFLRETHDPKFKKAFADMSKAISLEPQAEAYAIRGAINRLNGKYAEALSDFSSAIDLAPDDSSNYEYRAKLRMRANMHREAARDFASAWQKSPPIRFHEFFDVVKDIELSLQTLILESCVKLIYTHMQRIVGLASQGIRNVETVVHYTKLTVADALFSTRFIGGSEAESKFASTFRYYNAVYMNDPEEGEILLEYFDDSEIIRSFRRAEKGEENGIYLGSFLPVSEGGSTRTGHDDELVLWRTYGKDENDKEAAGCSLVIDTNFFDSETSYLRFPEPVEEGQAANTDVAAKSRPHQSLRRVLYYDRRLERFVGTASKRITRYLDEMKIELQQLLAIGEMEEATQQVKDAIDKIVYLVLSEIRYFFKSSDYSFESELRVVQYAPPQDERVMVESSAPSGGPRRLYIEADREIQRFVERIILGPKVNHPERWLYLDALIKKRGLKARLEYSGKKFQ